MEIAVDYISATNPARRSKADIHRIRHKPCVTIQRKALFSTETRKYLEDNPHLTDVTLLGPAPLRNLQLITGLSHVKKLVLAWLPKLSDFTALSTLPNLESLNATEGTPCDFTSAWDLPRLTAVGYSISKQKSWRTSFTTMSGLTRVRRLSLYDLNSPDLRFLSKLRELTHFKVTYGKLTALDGIGNAKGLLEIELYKTKTKNAGALANCHNLQKASIDGLTSLSFLTQTQKLQWLTVCGPTTIPTLAPVAANASIRTLILSKDVEVTDRDISPLVGHPTLEVCWVPRCLEKALLAQKVDSKCEYSIGSYRYILSRSGTKKLSRWKRS